MAGETGFKDRVAFVTGGASGIGEATCRELANEGAKVAIADLDLDKASALAAELADLGTRSLAVHVDVSNADSVEAAIEKVISNFGALNFAVNNAGISTKRGPLASQGIEDWHRALSVNLSGIFYCMRSEIPHMIEAGGGAIVNMASILGVVATAGSAAYIAAKHGVVGLTKVAALDYAAQKIRVNAVAPGYVETPLLASRSLDEINAIAAKHPLGRLASAQEIAHLAVFLLSDRASFMTGSVHLVDGGYTAR